MTHPAFILALALGCAVPPAHAAQEAPTPDRDALSPIHFGDPEGEAGDQPFFPGSGYDAAIPTAGSVLGYQHATRLSHHAEILACFETWARASERVTLATYGRTHEGRELVYAVITSPRNHARLDAIRADLARLHDPRGLAGEEAERIVSTSPAAAWMGYSIHGDELSGADAAVALGYHLAAATGADVQDLLERIVVVIDPVMNPDGRERIISMVEQSAGHTPNLDYASMHRGRWPYGRGNHYLFDMNRDWMAGTQPETRGRWKIARSFHPQLFVDAHEMGSLDTYLFYPQNRPLNPYLAPNLVQWQRRYAEGAAAAFDRHGWSYYTREWADAWAPFYSDAWGSLTGATGILYEQAGTGGFPLRRASGELLTYRESVHHQAVASLANLQTLAAHREEALRDYLVNQQRNVAPPPSGPGRMFVCRVGKNPDRMDELARILQGQAIEVTEAAQAFEATDVVDAGGGRTDHMSFQPGTLVVSARQPLGPMVQAFLGFDPRMQIEDLRREREELERKGATRIYDLTAWSLARALDVDAYWCDEVAVTGTAYEPAAREPTRIVGKGPAVGWVVPGFADSSVAFAARAMEHGLQVNASDHAFSLDGDGAGADGQAGPIELPPGSLLIRLAENEGGAAAVEKRVRVAAAEAGVRVVHRVATGLAPGEAFPESPDLGGGHFHLLSRPRVAVLANAPVAEDAYGHLWYYLDAVLGVPFTLVDAQALGSYDLRRYNVLVIPPHRGDLRSILDKHTEALKAWVQSGGTLIACGNSAAELTSGRAGISEVSLRRDALEDLTPFRLAFQREQASREVEIDEAAVWGPAPGEPDEGKAGEASGPVAADEAQASDMSQASGEEDDPYAAEKVPEEHDTWLRLFSPHGVTLRGVVDPEAWITRGAGAEIPVTFDGSYVLLSKSPVRTAVRLAERERVRLGGLVWPEARERIAESAWLTVERVGNGQVVLFASVPGFRGYHKATGRFFANAVVFGPGLGARQPTAW